MNAGLSENLDPKEIEKSIESLEKEKKETENPEYEARESKVLKGRFAPMGCVYLIVTHKDKKAKMIYKNSLLIGSGLSQKDKEQICLNLWLKMKEKYSL